MSQADNLAALATNVNSSGVLQPASGGTGLTSPGTNGNVLTSNGTAWVSSTPGTYSQWTTTGSDIYYNTGNVGIGTSSPSYPLQVVKNANGAQRVLFSNNSSGISAETVIAVSNGTAEGSIRVAGTSYAGYGAYTANNTLVYNDTSAITIMADNATNGIIKFATGSNSERMRIDSSGNVAIGATSAIFGSRFGVKSSSNALAAFVDSTAAGAAYYINTNGSGQINHYATWSNSGVNAYHAWWVTTSGASQTQAMTLDVNGNVGIGTTSPGVRLDVVGGTIRSLVSGGTPIVYLNNGTTQHSIQNNSGVLGLFNDGTNVANLTNAGLFQMNSGYGSVATAYGCRAWVKFAGGSGSINGSGNVSSVTRNSTGNYTVNFTTAMPDTNYAVTGASKNQDNTTVGSGNNVIIVCPISFATGSIGILTPATTTTLQDPFAVSVAIFR